MTQAQGEKAVQRLYENANLRGELTDDEAEVLLGWGETKANELAAKNLDDEAFEAQFHQLSTLIGQINQFVGKREGMPAEAQQEALGKIAAAAGTMEHPITPVELEAFANQHPALDNVQALQALTALIKPQLTLNNTDLRK